MNIGHCTFGSSLIPMGPFPNMANMIHVLLVEHESRDHDKIINMLQNFSYQVTLVNLASTALSILSKERTQFDLVIANMNSPDSYASQLLQVAVKMDLLVILMSNDDDAPTTMRALEQGAFLCIKKPVTMQILGYLWQHVSREKLCRFKENEPLMKVIKYNSEAKGFGEEDVVEGNRDNAEKHRLSKKKVNLGTSEHDGVVFKRKVWTEWTVELHATFMDAAKQLGQGRCYPKDILELMNVPGLTRMQVASHLQKCRNAKWLPPDKRKSKQAIKMETSRPRPREKKPLRSKTMKFGCMPFVDETNIRREFASESSNHLLDEDNSTGPFELSFSSTGEPNIVYDGRESATPDPMTNISSNHISEDDAFELSIMDSLISGFQEGGGMDYNPSWRSLVRS